MSANGKSLLSHLRSVASASHLALEGISRSRVKSNPATPLLHGVSGPAVSQRRLKTNRCIPLVLPTVQDIIAASGVGSCRAPVSESVVC